MLKGAVKISFLAKTKFTYLYSFHNFIHFYKIFTEYNVLPLLCYPVTTTYLFPT